MLPILATCTKYKKSNECLGTHPQRFDFVVRELNSCVWVHKKTSKQLKLNLLAPE